MIPWVKQSGGKVLVSLENEERQPFAVIECTE